MADIQEYYPEFFEFVTIDASHIVGDLTTLGIRPATVTVATLASGFTADFYTDGVDDEEQINLALLAGAGGIVELKEGTYTIGSSVRVPSNTTLKGQSMWTTIIKGEDNSSISFAVVNANYQSTGDTNIGLQDFQIDCNGTNQPSNFAANGTDLRLVDKFFVNRVWAKNAGYSDATQAIGFGFDSSTKGTVTDCLSSTNTHYGFSLYKCYDVIVKGCMTFDNGRHGYGGGGDSQATVTRDLTFDSCISYNETQGFWLREINGLNINNCEINGNNHADISAGQTTFGIILAAVTQVNITNNRIHDIGGSNDAIRIDGSYLDPAEVSTHLNISDNNIYNIAKNGIFMRSTGGGTSQVVIANNNISDCIAGSGIICQSSEDAIIKGNFVESSGLTGIITGGTSAGDAYIISDNISKNNGQAGTASNTYGIIAKVTNSVVTDNVCYDDQLVQTQTHGIRESSPSDSNIITGNNLANNATTGFLTFGTNGFYGWNKGSTNINTRFVDEIDFVRDSAATIINNYLNAVALWNTDTTDGNGTTLAFIGTTTDAVNHEFAAIKAVYRLHASTGFYGDLLFEQTINNNRTEAARFYLGRLGIGTTTPTGFLDVKGSIIGVGGLYIDGLAAPSAPTVTPTGTAGVTSWGYKVTALSSTGETIGSTEGTTSTGNATLDGTNYNALSWGTIKGAISYKVYRTTAGGTPSSTGLLATVNAPITTYNDIGGVASGAVPTGNTTMRTGLGVASPTAILHLRGGIAAAGGGPFKMTSGTSLTTPEAGVMEFDGASFYLTAVATRKTIGYADMSNLVPVAPFSMNSQKITNLLDPTSIGDATTKSYVDAVVAGVRDNKDSVRVATTAALATNTRTGNILTASANGAIGSIDGVAVALNDRVLVKDEVTTANNGLYYVSAVGDGSNPWTLTRTLDADTSAEVTGGLYVWANEGTANADTGWLLITNDAITLNTTGLSFTQISGLGQVVAGTGLTKSANTLNVVGTANQIIANADTLSLPQDIHTGASPTFAGLVLTSKVSTYDNIVTAGKGTIPIHDVISATAQVADIADTNFANAGVAGLYRISYYLVDTTADLTAGAVTLNIKFNDGTAARTVSSSAVILTATSGFTQGVIFARLGSGNVTYGITHTGIFGTADYALYCVLERLS